VTIIYNSGLDLLRNFETDDFECLLLNSGYTEDPTDEFVSDLTPGTNEITTLGLDYFRAELTNKTRTVDNFLNRISYDCDDPFFGDPAIGQFVDHMVLFRNSGSDATSPLVACISVPSAPTTGTGFVIVLNSAGLIYTDQGA
jgi:hypothetical protein